MTRMDRHKRGRKWKDRREKQIRQLEKEVKKK